NNDAYGDVLWVDTNFSSTSEMIYELSLNNDKLKMNEETTRLIYAGIVGDTGRFMFPNTTNKTFRYTAQLIEYSFDRQKLYNELYLTIQKLSQLLGYILQKHSLSASGLSTVKLTKEILEAHYIHPNETGKIAGILGNIEGNKVRVRFIEGMAINRRRRSSKSVVINHNYEQY